MPHSDDDHIGKLICGICETSFPTLMAKEEHLRRHCVLCKAVFATREELLAHMKGSHSAEERSAVFWPLGRQVAPSKEDEDGWSEDERDLLEYWREHGKAD